MEWHVRASNYQNSKSFHKQNQLPYPHVYLKNTTYERKDITSGFDVEQIREEIMNEEIMNEEYERGMLDYSSSEEDNYSEENY